LSYEYAEANAAFASGQVATMLQWNAAAGELTSPETAPAVAEVTTTVAPPAGPEGRFTHVHGLGLGINANAENPEGAQAFLQWLATPEAMAIYARAGGAPGLTGEALAAVEAERPDLAQLGDYAATTATS
jgi:multiple sugar transport system substrate-binding protein